MSRFLFAAFAIGFASCLAQLTLLREFLGVLGGNELVIGLILGFWLLFTGAGSYLEGVIGGDDESVFGWSLAVTAAVFPVTVYLARTLSADIFVRGGSMGLHQTILTVAPILAAYCTVYGIQFAKAARILSFRGKGKNLGYVLDSAGSAFGGVIFAALLVFWNPFSIAYAASFANLAALFVSYRPLRPVAVLLAVVLAVSAGADLQDATNKAQYPGQTVLGQEYTRYGNIVATKTNGQVNIYENGVPIFSSDNAIASEEAVHYAMSQREGQKTVLLIGGGMSGALDEALKYGLERIDYVELDPGIIRMSGRFVKDDATGDPRVNIIIADGREYVKSGKGGYDAVIIDLPPPTTAQLNRFYTREFYAELKGVLKPGGVISARLPPVNDYMSDDAKRMDACEYETLKSVYKEVIALPGGSTFFLASDTPLDYGIGELIRKRGIKTAYVNDDYLGGLLTGERIQGLQRIVSAGGQVNTDHRPLAYQQYLNYWFTQYGLRGFATYATAAILIISAAAWMALKPVESNVFASGFTGMTLQIAIMLFFQAAYGYIYYQMGLIFAAYMSGLVLGASLLAKFELRATILAIAAYSILLPAAASISSPAAYLLLALSAGVLAGAVIPQAVSGGRHPRKGLIAFGRVFSLDYWGAFGGIIVTTLILIPAVGLDYVCLISAAVSLVGYARLRIEA